MYIFPSCISLDGPFEYCQSLDRDRRNIESSRYQATGTLQGCFINRARQSTICLMIRSRSVSPSSQHLQDAMKNAWGSKKTIWETTRKRQKLRRNPLQRLFVRNPTDRLSYLPPTGLCGSPSHRMDQYHQRRPRRQQWHKRGHPQSSWHRQPRPILPIQQPHLRPAL